MTRRSLFELTLRAVTVPAGAEFVQNWLRAANLSGHALHIHLGSNTAPPQPPLLAKYQPRFFSPEDFEALSAFTEILIPTDETPGAREAQCALFIDFVLAASGDYSPGTQRTWHDAMRELRESGFHSANAESRWAIVQAISLPERDHSKHHPAFAAYLLIKRENAFAFYTSRAGLIDCLDYRGNTYNLSFPACDHPEHHVI